MSKFYCVKQHDKTDCGAACIATISKQYGRKKPISKIREIAGTDKAGTNALGLVKAAQQLGFDAKGVRGTEADFNDKIPLPAIAHVEKDDLLHYVVIHKIEKKRIAIADPAEGIVKYSYVDFFNIWSGVLILLTSNDSFEKKDKTQSLFSRFFSLLFPHKKLMTEIVISSIILTLLGMLASSFIVLPSADCSALSKSGLSLLNSRQLFVKK